MSAAAPSRVQPYRLTRDASVARRLEDEDAHEAVERLRRDEEKEAEDRAAALASAPVAAEAGVTQETFLACCKEGASVNATIWIADLEFHWLGADAPICQIYAVRLASDENAYNAYVFHRPLAPDWMKLVHTKGVELAPWDDPAVAVSFADALLGFIERLDSHAVVLFKGTDGSDMQRLAKQARSTLPAAVRDSVVRSATEKKLRFMAVDKVWKMLQPILPHFLRERLFAKRGGVGRKLGVMWDALFWHPVLVHLPRAGADEAYDQPDAIPDVTGRLVEKVAELDAVDTATARKTVAAMFEVRLVREETVFLASKNHQPAWHTAHTDTLATRCILTFLLSFAEFYQSIELVSRTGFPNARSVRSDRLSLHLMATKVVHDTKWFRESTLFPTENGANFCRWVARDHSHSLADTLRAPAVVVVDPPARRRGAAAAALVLAAGPPSINNAASVVKAREKRMLSSDVITIYHGDDAIEVYVPAESGRDAIKVRALKNLVATAPGPHVGKTIFDRLEQDHGMGDPALERIGDRPWYYYPGASGKLHPGYQILHSRRCLDRKNGHKHGQEPEWDKDNITYYDFDRLGESGAPGYKLQFCKSCKMYAAVPAVPAPAAADDDLALLILLLAAVH